jgi:osmoprotectant transport system substrate-binding protein
MAEDGMIAYPPTPFTSSNEVGVKRSVARRDRLRTISDLRRVDGRFTLYGAPECRERRDCLAGLRDDYGLRFRRFVPVAISRRFEVLEGRPRVASIVFTTDPQISREDIVLLEDDRRMFPPNNSTFVVKRELAERAGPALGRVLGQLQKGLTAEVMQDLNAAVDLDRRSPRDVAAEHLRRVGLIG